jgi:hypothetical protein
MAIFQQATLTNLRSLQYGDDTIGGGNSGEPYITTAIPPALQQQVESTNIWNSDSGLIRGGFAGATRASATDFTRISKFLTDPPRGPMFIIKQVGLQLSNPQLEAPRGAGSTLNNLIQGNFSTIFGGEEGLNTNIGTTRIYNGGINTLLQVPLNAFGGHIIRHGLLPIESNSAKYENVARNNDPLNVDEEGKNNRLVRLKAKLEPNENADIARYISGPGSLDGIGITTIPRYYNTLTNNTKPYIPLDKALIIDQKGNNENNADTFNLGYFYARPFINLNYYNAQGVSLQYFDNSETLITSENNILPPAEGRTNNLTENSQIDQNVIDYSATGRNYDTLRRAIANQQANNQIGNTYLPTEVSFSISLGAGPEQEIRFTAPLTFTPTGKSRYKGLDLSKNNIDTRLGLAQAQGYGDANDFTKGKDSIGLTPVYLSDISPNTSVTINGKTYGTRDLIKFRIEAVNNDNPKGPSAWMVFRAYLKDITDTPNPTWNTVNYVGRGEPFYIYKGFERSLSFTLQVAAMSEEELKPMWQKLNYLYSNTMPDYSNNVMRAPYMKLTLGDYMFRQPGIIKNLTYTIGNDSPWEIAINEPEIGSNLYELPHVMTIQMTFAPIHDFLPRKFPTVFVDPLKNWSSLPAFVADRQTNQYRQEDNPWLTSMYNTSTVGGIKNVGTLPVGKPK